MGMVRHEGRLQTASDNRFVLACIIFESGWGPSALIVASRCAGKAAHNDVWRRFAIDLCSEQCLYWVGLMGGF